MQFPNRKLLRIIKKRMKEKSDANANIRAWFWTIVLSLVLLFAMIKFHFELKKLGHKDILNWIIPFLTGGAGLFGIMSKFRSWIKTKASQSIYQKKLNELIQLGLSIDSESDKDLT